MSPQRVRPTVWTNRKLLTLTSGDHTIAEGLVLRVRLSGGRWVRRWAIRYRVKRGAGRGPSRRLHIGVLDGPLVLDIAVLGLADIPKDLVLDLEGAKNVAHALLSLASRGIDPMQALNDADQARRDREAEVARRAQHGTLTLRALFDRFFEARAGELRKATLDNWRGLAKSVLAPLGDRDPATITAAEVRRFHRRIGADGRRVTANRAFELLSVVYSWAMKAEAEDGEPLLSATPCARGSIEPFPEAARTRWLDSEELKALWNALNGEVYGDAFRLLLWTGARKSEALGAEWHEVDLRARLWCVPAERSKTGEPRKIPLSAPAHAMLTERRAADPKGRWIFPSPVRATGPVRSIQATLARVQKRSATGEWTLHDLRRTVRTGLSALGVPVSVAEFLMGHLAPAMVRNYDRHEPIAEAASALDAWARRLDSFVTGEPEAASVVPFTRGR